MNVRWSSSLSLFGDTLNRNDAVGMGSAPALGAVGRALAAHTGRVKPNHRLVRPGAPGFGARARRTAAGAAALPRNSTAWFRLKRELQRRPIGTGGLL